MFQLVFSRSRLAMDTREQCVKYVQSIIKHCSMSLSLTLSIFHTMIWCFHCCFEQVNSGYLLSVCKWEETRHIKSLLLVYFSQSCFILINEEIFIISKPRLLKVLTNIYDGAFCENS